MAFMLFHCEIRSEQIGTKIALNLHALEIFVVSMAVSKFSITKMSHAEQDLIVQILCTVS